MEQCVPSLEDLQQEPELDVTSDMRYPNHWRWLLNHNSRVSQAQRSLIHILPEDIEGNLDLPLESGGSPYERKTGNWDVPFEPEDGCPPLDS